jgi:nucleotide sugar dehydrogenase
VIVAVVGLGAIGLPVAVEIASRGHEVIGGDISPALVAAVSNGDDPHGNEPLLGAAISGLVASGRLRATTDVSAACAASEAVIVLVPVIVDEAKTVDYTAIDRATDVIGQSLRPGQLVVYETTLPVGTTRNRFARALERVSGLKAGGDFFVAFSPERVLVGRVREDLQRYPKLIGGIDPESAMRAARFSEAALGADVRVLGSAETAEFAKLAETTYRSVNIGLANEFAQFCEEAGIDMSEAVSAANTQPYSHIHDPGIGVGGHCIPVYPYFYLAGATAAPITTAALAVNEEAPARSVMRLSSALGGLEGARVLVLGWGYREGSGDARFSVACEVASLLKNGGAIVYGQDPRMGTAEFEAKGYRSVDPAGWPSLDAVILQAGHPEYARLDPASFPGLRILLDGRNFFRPEAWLAAGITVLGVGRPEIGRFV